MLVFKKKNSRFKRSFFQIFHPNVAIEAFGDDNYYTQHKTYLRII